jgi:hypothetical protein
MSILVTGGRGKIARAVTAGRTFTTWLTDNPGLFS